MIKQRKIAPNIYRVNVRSDEGQAYHIVVCYGLDEAGQSMGFEVFRLCSSMKNDDRYTIPYDRQATFQEELRVLDQSFWVENISRKQEKDAIQNHLVEAYGKEVTVDEMVLIQPEDQPLAS